MKISINDGSPSTYMNRFCDWLIITMQHINDSSTLYVKEPQPENK